MLSIRHLSFATCSIIKWLRTLPPNFTDLSLDHETRRRNDVVTSEFAAGLSHRELFAALSETAGGLPIDEEIVEQLFSALKVVDTTNRTDEVTDQLMRYQVNVLSETRTKRALLHGGNQKDKRRPTHTLQQVSIAVDQMCSNYRQIIHLKRCKALEVGDRFKGL
jgi:hypothetical protein